jgi:glutamate N-acetyltransferase/amino-acid N-acetyltransferase
VACGLKESGDPDLGLVVADAPLAAVGVFTGSALPAAPVLQCRELLASDPHARAVVVNAGIANALTGEQGRNDARAMACAVEERVGGPVLVLSTGVIGVPLPMDRVRAGIAEAARRLEPGKGGDFARAILTTDTRPKTAAVHVSLPAGPGGAPPFVATVGGTAKGSGMIHPDLATMLAVVATDVPVSPPVLAGVLRHAVARSFNEITVDGDTSTNDTVLLLAGGAAVSPIEEDDPRTPLLESAVQEVMGRLARAIVQDGEGAGRVLELHVTGASDDGAARRVADAVARSSLVKTALAGADPNWGRFLAAAANAGVGLDARRISLQIAGIPLFAGGAAARFDTAAMQAKLREPWVVARLTLGEGPGTARKLTTDLTAEYVRINSEYTT